MLRNFVYVLFLINCISSAQVPAGLTPTQPLGWTSDANHRPLPVSFEENRGQADTDVRFISRSSSGILVLQQDRATVLLPQSAQSPGTPASMRMTFPGAAAGTKVEGDGLLAGRTNYLGDFGRGGSITGIPNYERVLYRSLYPGVDLIFHGSRGVLEHDFVVAPGGVTAQIRMAFPGARDAGIDGQGNLRIDVSGRELLLMRPRAYQKSKGKRREIAASFARLSNREFGFKLGRYDRRSELIIDPTFATFLGGSSQDLAYGLAVDANGNAYITGTTNSSDFPTTNGVLSQTLGNSTGFVTKLNVGGGLVYSTFITGTGYGIAVDAQFNAYVTGATGPAFRTTSGAFQRASGGGTDAFVLKLDPAGSSAVYASYLGGSGNDTGRGIAVDSNGVAYVTGYTQSANFPVAAAFQPQLHGLDDAFVAAVNRDGTGLVFSTFLGGIDEDQAFGIALDPTGGVDVTGSSQSSNFPTTSGVVGPTSSANPAKLFADTAFLAKFDTSGTLIYSTFLTGQTLASFPPGTPALFPAGTLVTGSTGSGIAVDLKGNAHVTGGILGSNSGALIEGLYVAVVNSNASSVLRVAIQPANPGDLNFGAGVYADANGEDYVTGALGTRYFVGNADTLGRWTYQSTLGPGAGSGIQGVLNTNGTVNVYSAGGANAANFLLFGAIDSTFVPNGPHGYADNTLVGHSTATQTPLNFHSMTPCRVADTRDQRGPFGGPALQGGTARDFFLPLGGCDIPASARAYSMNVAVVPRGPLGFLTVWPSGQSRPLASTLNSLDGRIKSNAAIVPAGGNGGISVYATSTTDLILDINGYFTDTITDTPALSFYPLQPCRLVDTRNVAGDLGGPSLLANHTRTFPLLSAQCGLPVSARSYSLNVTVVPKGPVGFLTMWPTGVVQPVVATVNDVTGTIVGNAAIVPAGTNGSVNVFVTDATDVVVDVNGYFAAPGGGGEYFFPVTPCRVEDTRLQNGSAPLNGTLLIDVAASGCGIPVEARAYVFSATVVPQGPLGYLTLWPIGPLPTVATLNAIDGSITSNSAIVPSNNGSIYAFVTDPTHLILDINGYFAP